MPPKVDRYATKTHKRIDLILILITIALIFFAFRMVAKERAASRSSEPQQARQAQNAH